MEKKERKNCEMKRRVTHQKDQTNTTKIHIHTLKQDQPEEATSRIRHK